MPLNSDTEVVNYNIKRVKCGQCGNTLTGYTVFQQPFLPYIYSISIQIHISLHIQIHSREFMVER